MRPTRTWLWLLTLTAGSTLIAASGTTGRGLAAAVLALAFAKAELILRHYLHLARVPAIARGVTLGLGLFVALAAGLALIPG